MFKFVSNNRQRKGVANTKRPHDPSLSGSCRQSALFRVPILIMAEEGDDPNFSPRQKDEFGCLGRVWVQKEGGGRSPNQRDVLVKSGYKTKLHFKPDFASTGAPPITLCPIQGNAEINTVGLLP